MQLQFRVSLTTTDWHGLRTQYGLDLSNLWTHQRAMDYLEVNGFSGSLSYDYLMEKEEQTVIMTYDITEEFATVFALKFPEVFVPVRNYEVVELIA